MMDFFCTKAKTGTGYALMPAHQTDLEAIQKLPNHKPVRVKVTQVRNVDFHRKYFALLNYAFDCWEPPEPTYESGRVEKNFERFRKDIVILAGFYTAVYRLDGTTRIEPKSISFAKMDQAEFEELYSKTIDVIVKYVLTNYTGAELDAVVNQVMEFSG